MRGQPGLHSKLQLPRQQYEILTRKKASKEIPKGNFLVHALSQLFNREEITRPSSTLR